MPVEVTCNYCGKKFYKKPSWAARSKVHYCSVDCYEKFKIKRVVVVCELCGKDFLKTPSQAAASYHHYCSRDCFAKHTAGANSPHWKGGITNKNLCVRTSQKYHKWRLDVFKRDSFICSKCGDPTGGNLEAHHILAFSRFPEARLVIDNGSTLCKPCHTKFHSLYGTKNFTDKDYWRWLKDED